ncbi:MAG: HEAT repeat domain-containing protein [Planctomycetota bacterium]
MSRTTWALICALTAGAACADTVVLRSGHVLHGTVIDKGDKILVEVKFGGVTIDRDDVLSIELSDGGDQAGARPAEDTLLLRNGRVLHGNVRFSKDGTEVILSGDKGEVPYPRAAVSKILRRDGSTEIPGLTDDSEQGRELQASIKKLVADLGSEDTLAKREAVRELLALGPFARDLLEELKPEGGAPLLAFLTQLDRLEAMRKALPREAESEIPRLHERLVADEPSERQAAIKAVTLEFPDASAQLLLEVIRHDPDPTIRSYCVGQLGALRHFEELGQVLQIEDGPLRLAAAFALGDAGIPAGVPILIEALRLKSDEIRAVAAERLRDYTGQFFGYRPQASSEERELAIQRWEKWWAANGDELLRRSIKAVAPDLAGVRSPRRRTPRRGACGSRPWSTSPRPTRSPRSSTRPAPTRSRPGSAAGAPSCRRPSTA